MCNWCELFCLTFPNNSGNIFPHKFSQFLFPLPPSPSSPLPDQLGAPVLTHGHCLILHPRPYQQVPPLPRPLPVPVPIAMTNLSRWTEMTYLLKLDMYYFLGFNLFRVRLKESGSTSSKWVYYTGIYPYPPLLLSLSLSLSLSLYLSLPLSSLPLSTLPLSQLIRLC